MRKTFAALACAAATLLALPAAALAAAIDSPLRLLVGYPPGGSADRVARVLAAPLEKSLGVPVIVENRAGAGGRIAAQAVRNAGANENVIMIANPAVMVVAPEVFPDVGYDPVKDFSVISLVAGFRFGLGVAGGAGIERAEDLAAWVKANPGAFNVGVPGTGSLPHFFALMLARSIGESVEVVGYRGSAPLVTDLIGGQVPLAVDTLESQVPQHKAGRIRILATSGEAREADLPDVPTFREAGIDTEAEGWFGLFSNAAMPADKQAVIVQATAAAMQDPAVQDALRGMGYEPLQRSAADSAQALEAFRAQWLPVVKDSGYKAEQ